MKEIATTNTNNYNQQLQLQSTTTTTTNNYNQHQQLQSTTTTTTNNNQQPTTTNNSDNDDKKKMPKHTFKDRLLSDTLGLLLFLEDNYTSHAYPNRQHMRRQITKTFDW